ncbi:MAG TPA: rhodanese-like domain-containing protein [Polyangiaceae bacterium]
MGLFDFFGSPASGSASETAKDWVQKGALLLDVRTAAEFSSGHVAGAKNIPVQELATRISELPSKSQAVVVYCRSGGRSAAAASMLRQVGYQVHDLGAMSNWKQ